MNWGLPYRNLFTCSERPPNPFSDTFGHQSEKSNEKRCWSKCGIFRRTL